VEYRDEKLKKRIQVNFISSQLYVKKVVIMAYKRERKRYAIFSNLCENILTMQSEYYPNVFNLCRFIPPCAPLKWCAWRRKVVSKYVEVHDAIYGGDTLKYKIPPENHQPFYYSVIQEATKEISTQGSDKLKFFVQSSISAW